ncbi:hypothetical protein [Polaromonas sp. JS666]|uniref:hypothetical protein n=1 Tax=Polaromonas sp. (strain JS666 / ATCC BAA-500) TaxID=296591 RepID=UPI00094301A8|nr:hypothetical protein [Polaromonas sp. JS666]
MAYLVFCTFDLKGASSQDYQDAYADLASLGLKKVQSSQSGSNVVIPTTAAMGFFDGANAVALRTKIESSVKAKFTARRFKSEIFIVLGSDWAWSASTT